MGNIALKSSCCTSKISLRCDEPLKVQRSTITNKEQRLREEPATVTNEEKPELSETTRETFLPVTQPTFPTEIIIEILSWLSVKDLLRMKCVCKQWYALTQDRHLIEKQMSRANHVGRFNRLPITSSGNNNTSRYICGCDGLLLEKSNATKKLLIRNQATHQILDLPDPQKKTFGITFSFIPSTGDYKLVSIYDNKEEAGTEGCEVLTVGNDVSWRPLKIPNLNDSEKKREKIMVVSAGRYVHCIRIIEVGSKFLAELVSLDLGSESFTTTTLPQGLFSDWKKVFALDWNGFLSFADRLKENLNVLVLEDLKKLKWGKDKIVVPLTFMKDNPDLIEDLVPLFAKSDVLWFWLKNQKIFTYNMESAITKDAYTAPKGYTTGSMAFYFGPPSMVTLKGMRPEMM